MTHFQIFIILNIHFVSFDLTNPFQISQIRDDSLVWYLSNVSVIRSYAQFLLRKNIYQSR